MSDFNKAAEMASTIVKGLKADAVKSADLCIAVQDAIAKAEDNAVALGVLATISGNILASLRDQQAIRVMACAQGLVVERTANQLAGLKPPYTAD